MKNRVVITGLGCISPVGNDVESAWQNIVDGISGVGLITQFNAEEYKTRIAAEVKEFDGNERFGRREARRMDIVSQYALAAAIQAVENANLQITDSNRDQIGAVIGTGIGGIG
ncbi:MAG: beta-ketoacyl-[acyl-carrier-protein] synthase II, partial [Chloroflexi bacterium]|nr:beta-ketoacyl-[acyl-carrier-protein] synthase II [Chloroflexota bacterium]